MTTDSGFDFPSRQPRPSAPAWPVSRVVLWLGVALIATMLAALAAVFVQDRRDMLEGQLERNALYARLIQEQVARQIDAVSVSLARLASTVASQGLNGSAKSAAEMQQLLVSLTQLRGVAAVDLQGNVLASDVPDDIGRRVDLSAFGTLPAPGLAVIGRFVAGRGLADLAIDRAVSTVPPSHGFMPLLRRVQGSINGMGTGADTNADLLLVAMISTESLADQMRLTLFDASSRVLLVGWNAEQPASLYADTSTEADIDGTQVCATASASVCEQLAVHPAMRNYLPAIESASYIGAGASPGEQTVAFRALRAWPLLVLVERPLASVLTEWHALHFWRRLVFGLALLVVPVLTAVTVRSLRAREKVRGALGRAHARAARSAREMAVIVRSVQQLLFRTDAHGTLTFVNAHGPTAVGRLFEDVLGKRFQTLVRADEQDRVRAMFGRDGLDGSAAVRSVTVTIGAAPSARRFDVAVVALFDGRRISGFAGSAVDITEREEAQALLAEQLAFSALLLELIPLPTAMYDSDGRYLSVNRAWHEYGGRSQGSKRSSAVGGRVTDDMVPAEARQFVAKNRALLARGGQMRVETQYTQPQGPVRDVVINKVVVPGRDGVPLGILVTVTDVTDLYTAVRATQEARAAAEESLRVKSEFIANISHELRTPLQAILGFAELGTLPGRSRDQHAAMFGDIHGAGRRMLALVNDLLDVSTLESAAGTIHLERADLRPLLREVAHELQPLLQARQLVLQATLPLQPLLAQVDPRRFQQVVRNVLANAIKFAPAGSSLVFDAHLDQVADADGTDHVSAAAAPNGAGVHLSLRDHGPGIPPAELEKIFEAFVQSSHTKDGSGGTGLGLAICRKIMAAHGGTICAENMAGGGSRFHIRLPKLRQPCGANARAGTAESMRA